MDLIEFSGYLGGDMDVFWVVRSLLTFKRLLRRCDVWNVGKLSPDYATHKPQTELYIVLAERWFVREIPGSKTHKRKPDMLSEFFYFVIHSERVRNARPNALLQPARLSNFNNSFPTVPSGVTNGARVFFPTDCLRSLCKIIINDVVVQKRKFGLMDGVLEDSRLYFK